MSKAEKAQELLKYARTQLILGQPFFGVLALKMKMREAREGELPFPTIATTGRELLFNSDFIIATSEGKDLEGEPLKVDGKDIAPSDGKHVLTTAITHEVLHAAFLFFTRRGHRHPILWSIAHDYAINWIMKKSRNSSVKFMIPDGWCCDQKYDGWSADDIYVDLKRKAKKQGGKGKGQGGKGQKKGQDGSGSGNQNKGGHNHQHGGCGWLKKPTDENGQCTEAELKKWEAEMKRNVSQAATSAKMQGRLPDHISRLVEEMLDHKVDWRSVLRQFIEEVAKNDYNWQRCSRRAFGQSYYLPGLHNLECGELVVAIDTSGSIGQEELNVFASELSGILHTVKPKLVHVIYIDTRVAHYETFGPDDLPLKLKPHGGGGTDFAPAFEWVKEQGILPKALIYFTDLCCNSFGEMPDYSVLWCVKDLGSWAAETPFGKVIEVDIESEE